MRRLACAVRRPAAGRVALLVLSIIAIAVAITIQSEAFPFTAIGLCCSIPAIALFWQYGSGRISTPKAQRGLIIKPDISSPDFYITAATIIPVLFLALVLEGGLWKWIQEQISDASDPPTAIRVFVSLLQVFAVFVLIAGALGEMTELYALWQADYSNVLSDIVFSTTALLVILLTAELSLQIPGLWLVTFSTIDLRLSIDEELRWSGVCARSSGRPG